MQRSIVSIQISCIWSYMEKTRKEACQWLPCEGAMELDQLSLPSSWKQMESEVAPEALDLRNQRIERIQSHIPQCSLRGKTRSRAECGVAIAASRHCAVSKRVVGV